MTADIQLISEKKLTGNHVTISYARYAIGPLWQSFMPKRKMITNSCGNGLYSVALYPKNFFTHFNPATPFERWAAVEVTDFENIPEGMEALIIPAGLYAVFHYKGIHTDHSFFQSILQNWLPSSGYQVDDRPHFEWLGEKYKNNDPESEEEIWIPVK